MMENKSNSRKRKVSKEEVIEKLKDDGDFDNLRLKIIRKLKDNEELRSNIISAVNQSAVCNRPGAEDMKPRQLSDAIYDDVGNKVMSQISDCLWHIIKSGDGMKNEITETVQSVYSKLAEPLKKIEGKSSTHEAMPVEKASGINDSIMASVREACDTSSDNDPKEPPGFTLSGKEQNKRELPTEERKEVLAKSDDIFEPGDAGLGVPPGFSQDVGHIEPCDGSDEDPDVPPGFG
ncbi:hypothetical protein CFOL_v3_23066 [Cephalotus follicularis]|uniref:Uncharacterized protein n=1 Tax=Cephalotus follicularis TaxID=3775 RepID=A0A1Q3CHR0_CEPFO|nr:hypothetical protein CFOL_v3_23066 [Cephalotus follicularis]